MIAIDFVAQGRHAVFSEEDGALELVHLPLTGLDLESEVREIRCQYGEYIIALQSLVIDLSVAISFSCCLKTAITSSTKPGGGSVLGKVENLMVLPLISYLYYLGMGIGIRKS